MLEIEREIKGSPLTKPIQVGVDSYMRTKFFCIVGSVVDFDPDQQMATVRIDIQKTTPDGYEDHPEIIKVPVGFPGDDVVIGHKISPGVEGLIYFSQRGVANWKNTGGTVEPSTTKKFDISDAFFDPRFRSTPNVIKGFKNDGAWMATKDGAHYFHLKSDGSIDVKSTSTNWDTGEFNITSTAFNVTAPMSTFNGDLTATGTIKAAIVNALTGLLVAGVNMLTHRHGGVTRGNQNTDGPQ
ncbi:hypothetical protein NVP1029O_38 [Vibrio phage 1.029.O._10N.261.55.A7]|nr:hypothetical protein NVP1029O_38 [Vibrio phage 1.029.O._10N.261.55.A7]